ncbi:pyridoxamine 5'-phosphate oxidase family protein [Paenibacillus thermotolerans]|uniref:pyridoxamine 5'-phosphate oxidase family protein n=1 Tax=Paenibacillus thermotolerans TaxID=3027807 RepID=UPI00236822C9|nr:MULTISPECIES: pyridoxamine 5'-phosphate oxidase family protein [unclassified Paenibacillus]
MEQTFRNRITTVDELEELRPLFGYPSKLSANKVINALDSHGKLFISKSPFLMISTSSSDGRCDVSPRGDAPGFVHVIDDRHLFIPDRPGNRRMDSIRNILSNPRIGLIFMIPGLEETFRVNGKACVSRDEAYLRETAVNGKQPIMGIGVEVEECYLHCAKSFKRSGLWDPSRWLPAEQLPNIPEMMASHVKSKISITAGEVSTLLDESYTKRLY